MLKARQTASDVRVRPAGSFLVKKEKCEYHSDTTIQEIPNIGPDVKRLRLMTWKNMQEGFAKRLQEYNPTKLLEEILNDDDTTEKCLPASTPKSLERLQDFSNVCLIALTENEHISCIRLLIKIASATKVNAIILLSFQCILSIFQRSSLKQEIWNELSSFLCCDQRLSSCFHPSSIHLSILAIFHFALSNSLLSNIHAKLACDLAQQSILSSDHNHRIAAINFFVAIFEAVNLGEDICDFRWLENMLCKMADDCDARVRLAAVNGLSMLSRTERPLSFSVYGLMKELCSNSASGVRIEALRILRMFSSKQPETEVQGQNNVRLRLVDDAFAVVCHAINDLDVTVRAEAARLLGLFERVSDSFLDQTLDKKLLNTMRFTKESDRDSRKAFHKSQQKVSSQWSTGKKLGEDIPAEKIEEEQTSMISIGACGAFVTALEDEFMVVRQAGVYSLGKLAADRPFFAADAIDHLADMFNDEIEEVRLDAVRALTPLVVHGVLQKEQLDTILTVLDDALPDSREALRILLGKSTLASVECLRFCVEALLNCLRRFPIDRSSIYLCLSQLGRRHASFVQSMVYDLLELNPVFDITERSLEDYMYLAKLIFILNAASIHEPICSLLPEFAVRHYRYLRCSMSNLVPDVPTFSTQDSINGVLLRSPMDDNKETRTLLERSYEVMLEASMAESYEQRMVLQKFILKDLVILYEANEKIASTARFLSKLMHCFTCHDLIIQMITFGGDLLTTLSVIEEGLLIIDYAENEFHSVDNVVLSSLAECAFRLRILRFALQLERKPSLYQNAVDAFAVEIDFLKRRLSFLETTPSKSIMKLIDEIMEQIEYSETKKFVTCPGLTSLLQTKVLHLPHQFPSLGKIFMKWAEMVEPCETPSEPIRFIAGLPLAIPLNILLHNFNESDLRNFRIKVDYPDQTSNLFRPRQSDFKEISSQKVRLLCKVLVQSSAWSDAARVRLSCVLILPDRPFIHFMQDNSQFDIKDTQTRCISISVSPHSTKESSIDIPVYPMFGKAW